MTLPGRHQKKYGKHPAGPSGARPDVDQAAHALAFWPNRRNKRAAQSHLRKLSGSSHWEEASVLYELLMSAPTMQPYRKPKEA